MKYKINFDSLETKFEALFENDRQIRQAPIKNSLVPLSTFLQPSIPTFPKPKNKSPCPRQKEKRTAERHLPVVPLSTMHAFHAPRLRMREKKKKENNHDDREHRGEGWPKCTFDGVPHGDSSIAAAGSLFGGRGAAGQHIGDESQFSAALWWPPPWCRDRVSQINHEIDSLHARLRCPLRLALPARCASRFVRGARILRGACAKTDGQYLWKLAVETARLTSVFKLGSRPNGEEGFECIQGGNWIGIGCFVCATDVGLCHASLALIYLPWDA